MTTVAFSSSFGGARPLSKGHPRVGIVVTDGYTANRPLAAQEATKALNADITLFAVGKHVMTSMRVGERRGGGGGIMGSFLTLECKNDAVMRCFRVKQCQSLKCPDNASMYFFWCSYS